MLAGIQGCWGVPVVKTVAEHTLPTGKFKAIYLVRLGFSLQLKSAPVTFMKCTTPQQTCSFQQCSVFRILE